MDTNSMTPLPFLRENPQSVRTLECARLYRSSKAGFIRNMSDEQCSRSGTNAATIRAFLTSFRFHMKDRRLLFNMMDHFGPRRRFYKTEERSATCYSCRQIHDQLRSPLSRSHLLSLMSSFRKSPVSLTFNNSHHILFQQRLRDFPLIAFCRINAQSRRRKGSARRRS